MATSASMAIRINKLTPWRGGGKIKLFVFFPAEKA
jgi:hypothetical protein